MLPLKFKPVFRYVYSIILLGFICACARTEPPVALQSDASNEMNTSSTKQIQTIGSRYGLVIHGGAGTIKRENLSSEKEAEIRAKLAEALQAGYKILENGGESLEAVTTAIVILEDSPLFNASKGAVFTAEKKHELDASIMDGRDLNAGAVSSVTTIKNPILLAEQVMKNSKHVMLTGTGAEIFSRQQGLEQVSNDYFSTDFRLKQIEKALEKEKTSGIDTQDKVDEIGIFAHDPQKKFGTVGAVAIDQQGNLAAGTSTGGMTNKRFGRVGDSPIIGAGTYADNRSCAVSATGHGEYFIRYAVAHDVCARMLHGGKSLEVASDEVINKDLLKAGGDGGIIAIDKDGNFSLTFNTAGMYRGSKFSDEELKTGIFKNE